VTLDRPTVSSVTNSLSGLCMCPDSSSTLRPVLQIPSIHHHNYPSLPPQSYCYTPQLSRQPHIHLSALRTERRQSIILTQHTISIKASHHHYTGLSTLARHIAAGHVVPGTNLQPSPREGRVRLSRPIRALTSQPTP